MKKCLHLLLLLLWVFATYSCSSKKDDPATPQSAGDGISERSWKEGETVTYAEGETINLTFTANGDWTATFTQPLCEISPDKGTSGTQHVSVKMLKAAYSETDLKIKVEGYPFEASLHIQRKMDDKVDREANEQMDAMLRSYYLWNDEYKKLTPDFGVPYDEFLDNTLMNMTTNTLDKKQYIDSDGKPYYRLFSFVQKVDRTLSRAAAVGKVNKEKKRSFGFTNFLAGLYSEKNDVFLCVQGVYPDTPAALAGIGRGTMITKIDGQALTTANWRELYLRLAQPSAGATVTVEDSNKKEYDLTVAEMPLNPVLKTEVDTRNGHRIGYLCYDNFDAGFDEELFEAFRTLKQANVTDLIVDLRYNGGGYVMSADMMSSCIAGSACNGKVFASYRYNDDRMKNQYNGKRPEELFSYDKYKNLDNISLAAGALNMNRVYLLVGGSTASASELVINSLKGIGIDVVLIGTTTVGKNVGMEGRRLTTSEGNQYEFYPITFQSYNAQGEGDYEHGFTPTGANLIDERHPNGQYFEGYGAYGTTDDVLYARALTLITGETITPPAAVTRTAPHAMHPARVLYAPEPRVQGMIK